MHAFVMEEYVVMCWQTTFAILNRKLQKLRKNNIPSSGISIVAYFLTRRSRFIIYLESGTDYFSSAA